MVKDSLDKQMIEIEQLLMQEEQRRSSEKLADVLNHHGATARIKSQISEAKKTLAQLRSLHLADSEQQLKAYRGRLYSLTMLPDQREVIWAQQVLRLPNLLIVSIEENVNTQVGTEAKAIKRLQAIDAAGRICLNRFMKPRSVLSDSTARKTDMTTPDAEEASSREDIWAEVLRVLSGKFILTDDIDELQKSLEIYAMLHNLEYPVVLGTSLTPEVERYFHISLHFTSWKMLCDWIGYPLPSYPQYTGLHQAYGYLHILQAMSQHLIIQAQKKTIDEVWEEDELEEEENELEEDEWGSYEDELEDDEESLEEERDE